MSTAERVSKHTPGPWEFGAAYNGREYVFGADGIPVTTVRLSRKEYAANARLIAACPEMLKALQEIVEDAYIEDGTVCRWCGYRTEVGQGHIHNDVCRAGRAEAAIRKATEGQ